MTSSGSYSSLLRLPDVQHFSGFVSGLHHDRLLDRFRAMKEFEVAHTMKMRSASGGRVTVNSRKKLVYGDCCNGEFGLYIWDQTEDCYQMIEPMPAFGTELVELLRAAKIPGADAINHFLITFSAQGILPHHDKRFCKETQRGLGNESVAPIFLMSFGWPCKLLMASRDASGARTEAELQEKHWLEQSFNFNSGDLIVIPGVINGRAKHAVQVLAQEPGDLRVSVVFREVTAHHVCPDGNYYLRDGERVDVDPALWLHRQPKLPVELTFALVDEDESPPEGAIVIGRAVARAGVVTFMESRTPYCELVCKRALADGLRAMADALHKKQGKPAREAWWV